MSNTKGVLIVVGLCMVTLGGALCLRVWTWDKDRLIEEVLLELSRLTGGIPRCENIMGDLFPLPEMLLEGCQFSVEETVTVRAQAIKVRPSFVGIAVGRMGIRRMDVRGLDVHTREWEEMKGFLARMASRCRGRLGSLSLAEGNLTIEKNRVGQRTEIQRLNLEYDTSILGFKGRLWLDIEIPDGKVSIRGLTMDIHSFMGVFPLKIKRLAASDPQIEFQGQIEKTPDPGVMRLNLYSSLLDIPGTLRFAQLLWGTEGKTWAERVLRSGRAWDMRLEALLEWGQGLPVFKDARALGKISGLELEMPRPMSRINGLEGRFSLGEGVLELSRLKATGDLGELLDGNIRLSLLGPNPSGKIVGTWSLDLERAYGVLLSGALASGPKGLLGNMFRVRGHGILVLSLVLQDGSLTTKGILRGLKMWGRHRMIPYVFQAEAQEILFSGDVVAFKGISMGIGSSQIDISKGEIDLSSGWISLHLRKGLIDLDEAWALAKGSLMEGSFVGGLEYVTGRAQIEECELLGYWENPLSWEIRTRAVLNARVSWQATGEWEINGAVIDLTEDQLVVKESHWRSSQGSFSIKGVIEGWPRGGARVWMEATGDLKDAGIGLLIRFLNMETGLEWKTPASLKLQGLRFEGTSEASNLTFRALWESLEIHGQFNMEKGTVRSMRTRISDEGTNGTLSMERRPDGRRLQWEGRLWTGTLVSLFEESPKGSGFLEGDLMMDLGTEGLRPIRTVGAIEARGLDLGDLLLLGGLQLKDGKLRGKGETIEVEAEVFWDEKKNAVLKLDINLREEPTRVQGIIEAISLDIKELVDIVAASSVLEDKVRGSLGILVGSLDFMDINVATFQGDLPFGEAMLFLRTANVCGVGLRGKIDIGGNWRVELNLEAQNVDVQGLCKCIGLGTMGLGGSLDLSGRLSFDGLHSPDIESLRGSFWVEVSKATVSGGGLLEALFEEASREDLKGVLQGFDWEKVISGRVALGVEFLDGVCEIREFVLEMDGLEGEGMGIWVPKESSLQGFLLMRLGPQKGSRQLVALQLEGRVGGPRWELINPKDVPVRLTERLENKKGGQRGPHFQEPKKKHKK